MMFSILLICFAGLLRCQEMMNDNSLFMVNINDKDELVLFLMDLETSEFKQNCNFGDEYTSAYKSFKDYENTRSGGGLIFMDYNQYAIFLHDDKNNRHSGVIIKCQLDTQEVTKISHYDFFCDYMWTHGGDYAMCASTMNSTGTVFYEIRDEVETRFQIPYIAVPESGNTCFYDPTWEQFWCYSFSMNEERPVRTWTDTDLGGSHKEPCDIMIAKTENVSRLYTFGSFDCNAMFGIIEYEKENENYKAIVELILDYNVKPYTSFKWEQKGEQNLITKASRISSNVVASCMNSDVVFIKVFDENGISSLIRYDWKTGKDSVIDTSKIGSLEFMSQMDCS